MGTVTVPARSGWRRGGQPRPAGRHPPWGARRADEPGRCRGRGEQAADPGRRACCAAQTGRARGARGAVPEGGLRRRHDGEASALLGDGPHGKLMIYDDSGAHVVATCNSPAPVGLHVPFSAGTAVEELFRTGRAGARGDTYERTPLADVTRKLGIASDHGRPDRGRGSHPSRARRRHHRPPLAARRRGAARAVRGTRGRGDRQRREERQAHRLASASHRHRRRDPAAEHRDVHDGAQQRLVHAIIALKVARDAIGPGPHQPDWSRRPSRNVERASKEFRDIVRGILPRVVDPRRAA